MSQSITLVVFHLAMLVLPKIRINKVRRNTHWVVFRLNFILPSWAQFTKALKETFFDSSLSDDSNESTLLNILKPLSRSCWQAHQANQKFAQVRHNVVFLPELSPGKLRLDRVLDKWILNWLQSGLNRNIRRLFHT